jgi:hypothetical protein
MLTLAPGLCVYPAERITWRNDCFSSPDVFLLLRLGTAGRDDRRPLYMLRVGDRQPSVRRRLVLSTLPLGQRALQ